MAEPWIRVHANLRRRPVVLRAAEALGVKPHMAMGLLVEFWGSVSQHVVDGMIGNRTDTELEQWAGWAGKRGLFAAFIRDQHADEEGRVNEWDNYAGALETRREKDRERQRLARDKRRTSRGQSNGHHADGHADVTGVIRVTSALTRANDTKRYETIRKEKREKPAPLAPTPDEQRVLEHYRAVHPLRRTGDAEVKVVRKALALNYTADELIAAIDGNARDEWHVAKRKHELSYVLRNAEKIDTFRAAAVQMPLVDEATGALTAAGIAVMRGDR